MIRRSIDGDVDAEIASHLDMVRDELIASGMSPEEATREARRRFGDLTRARTAMIALDQSRERREWWAEIGQDVRYAIRLLRRSPVFTVVAVLTLALGVGASGAIFSIVRQVLIAPLEFKHPNELVRLWPANPRRDVNDGALSVPDLEDWRAGQQAFAEMAGFWYAPGRGGVALTGDGPPESLDPAYVTPTFFQTLGADPEVGRLPHPDELQESGERVVVLNDGLWRRRFGADRGIIGRAILLNGEPHVVVGVMPRSMRYPGTTRGPDVWIGALYQKQTDTPWKERDQRWIYAVGRLRPGVSLDQARAALTVVQRRLAATYPDADHGWDAVTARPLMASIVGDVRPALLVVLGAVGFVLLIAVINVAGLLLTRANGRAREFALRSALGGERARLARQVLTESLVLALLGAAAGLVVARITLHLIVGLASSELPRVPTEGLDWSVIALAFAIAIGCGLVFSAIPAIRTARLVGTRQVTASAEGQRLRQAFVIAQVAIAVVLVCGAGLMVRSLGRLLSTDPGFRPDHALAVRFHVAPYRYSDTAAPRFIATVFDRVRALPGVVSVAGTKVLPLEGSEENWTFAVVGEPPPPRNEEPAAPTFHVSADYFRTLSIPIIAGREFTPIDTLGAPDVIIVNEAFARKYVPGALDAVPGRLLHIGQNPAVRIVGVVRDTHQDGLDAAPRPMMYIDESQNVRSTVTMIVRTRGDPTAMTAAVREAIWSVDKDQAIGEITTLDHVVVRTTSRPRLLSILLDLFGGLGLLLGALGIYGVVAYTVRQRQAEIGIRMALGADRRRVLGMVMARGVTLTAIGMAIGLVAAVLAARGMRAVLFEITPTDPLTYALVLALLAIVALIATYIPARTAAHADPVTVLRAE
ncbi:MAG TPA: ABC transporter permease [Gemmatimonadaceae bacterium]|nr:ABC transporter permease [Gemmatimonadaceae bacterium]